MSADKYDGGYCLYIPWLEISQKNKRIKSLLLMRKVLTLTLSLWTIQLRGIPVLLTVNIHLEIIFCGLSYKYNIIYITRNHTGLSKKESKYER